jgi:imidazoleglycerol phosphate synthase cyclase subunit
VTARWIIPCLDVRDGRVVKGVRFEGHVDMGDAAELAARYRDAGADELVFYDITASPEGRTLDYGWVRDIARLLDIPFCVAGGIRSVDQAARCLDHGADKVSINSPALERPGLIAEMAERLGGQCVVVGVDSKRSGDDWLVHQYTGDPAASRGAETGPAHRAGACGRQTRGSASARATTGRAASTQASVACASTCRHSTAGAKACDFTRASACSGAGRGQGEAPGIQPAACERCAS